MAQIVIFAPKGEDVSAGEEALKGAGHEVEVVEATPANLMHMAIGMVEDEDVMADMDDAPAEEVPAEEPELPAEEEPAEDLGECLVNGVPVMATTGNRYRLTVSDLQLGSKITCKLNESEWAFYPTSKGVVKVPSVTFKAGTTYYTLQEVELVEGTRATISIPPGPLRSLFT